MITLTDRERAIAIGTAGVFAVIGAWIGLFMVPDAALSVPMETTNGRTSAAYHPVPTGLPIFSVVIVGLSLWGAYSQVREIPDDTDTETEAVTDGGENE